MATIATKVVDVDNVKIRWEESYVSAGLNRKFVGVFPTGRYRGYIVTAVAGQPRLNVAVDATENDSVAVYESNGYSLTVREIADFELDGSSEFPLGADKTYYVILQVTYVITGDATTANIKLVDEADVVSSDIRLAKVDVLNGATNFDAATISQSVTDTDLPLATADKYGFFQPIPLAEPFYTAFSVTNKTSVQLSGEIYLGKIGTDTQVVRNQYFGLLDSSGGNPLVGSDSKPIQIKGIYKEEAGTTEIIPNSADTDSDGYYTDPWVVFDLGEATAESTDTDYTGDLIVWAGRKRSIGEFGIASFMIGAAPSVAGPDATKTRRGLFPATVIAEPYKRAVTGLTTATYIDVTDKIYMGSGLAAGIKNKLCVLLNSDGESSLLGDSSAPILVSDITKDDDSAITAPDLDADGFYAGPFRVVLDFADNGSQVNYSGDCVVWYGRQDSIGNLSVDQILRSCAPSATGQIATGRQQGFLPAKYIAEPKRLDATADGGGLFCTLDGDPKVYIGTTDTDTQNIKELYFSLLDSNGFNVLLGSDQNRIGIDRITDDGGTELNPSTDNDGDGFYNGQVRIYFDFTDTIDTTYTSGLKVWAGEKGWFAKLDVDVLLEGGGVGGAGAGTTTLNEAYTAGATIAAVAGTPMSVNMTQNAADQKAIASTHNFNSNNGAAVEVTGSNPSTESVAFKVAGTVTHAVKAATGDVELDNGVVTLGEKSADPANVANKGKLYTKDVSGVTEYFYIDDAGTVTQVTSGGKVIAGILQVTGPLNLPIGAVADGQFLKRSGSNIIGDVPSGASLDSAYNGGEEITVDVDPVTLNRTQVGDDESALKVNHDYDGNQGVAVEVIGTNSGTVGSGELLTGVKVTVPRSGELAGWYAIGSHSTVAKKTGGTWAEESHGLTFDYNLDISGSTADNVWMVGRKQTTPDKPFVANYDGASWTEHTNFSTGYDNYEATLVWVEGPTEVYVLLHNTSTQDRKLEKWNGSAWSNVMPDTAISSTYQLLKVGTSFGIGHATGIYYTTDITAPTPTWQNDSGWTPGNGGTRGLFYDSNGSRIIASRLAGTPLDLEFYHTTAFGSSYTLLASYAPGVDVTISWLNHLWVDDTGKIFATAYDDTVPRFLTAIETGTPVVNNAPYMVYGVHGVSSTEVRMGIDNAGDVELWNGSALSAEATGVASVYRQIWGASGVDVVGTFEGYKAEFSGTEGGDAVAFKVGSNATHALKSDSGVITMAVESSDPVEESSKGSVYTKTISGRAELFYRDDDSHVIQLTDNGSGGGGGAGSLDGAYNGGEEITVDVDPVTLNRTQSADDQQALKINQDLNGHQGAALEVLGTNTGETADGELVTGVKVTVPKKIASVSGEIWYAVGDTTIAKKDGTWSDVTHGFTLDHFNDVKGTAANDVWVVGQKTSGTPRPFIGRYTGSWAADTEYDAVENKEAILVVPVSSTEVYVLLFSTGGGQDLSIEAWNGSVWSTKRASAAISDPIYQAVKFGNSFGFCDAGGIDYTSDITVGSPTWQADPGIGNNVVGLTVDVDGNRLIAARRVYVHSDWHLYFYESTGFGNTWSLLSQWNNSGGARGFRNKMWADDAGHIFCTTDSGGSVSNGLLRDIESSPVLIGSAPDQAAGMYGISATNIKISPQLSKTGYVKAWDGVAADLIDEDVGVSADFVQVWGTVTALGSGKFEGYRSEFTESAETEAVAYRVGSGATHAMKADSGRVELVHDFEGAEGTLIEGSVVNSGDGLSDGQVARGSSISVAKSVDTTKSRFILSLTDVKRKVGAGAYVTIGPLPDTPNTLNSVHGTSASNVWVGGADGGNGYIAKWDSLVWTRNTAHPDNGQSGYTISSVSVFSEVEIWTLTHFNSETEHNIYKTEDGGESWVLKETGSLTGMGARIHKLGDTLAFVFNGGIRYSHDGGETWATDTSLGTDGSEIWIFAHEGDGVFYALRNIIGGASTDILRVYKGAPGNWGYRINEYYHATFGTDMSIDGFWVSPASKLYALMVISSEGNCNLVHGLEEGGTPTVENNGSATEGSSLWGTSDTDVTFFGDTAVNNYMYTWNGASFSTETVVSDYGFGNWEIEVGTGSVGGHRVLFPGNEISGDSIAYEVGAGASHALKAISGKIELDITQPEDDQSTIDIEHDFDSKRGAIIKLEGSVSGGGVIDGAAARGSDVTIEKKALTEKYRFIVSSAANDVKQKVGEADFATIGPLPDDPDSLADVHGSSANDVWAVGADASNGYIAKWDGTSWTRDTTHPRDGEAGTIVSVLVASSTEAWTYSEAAGNVHYIHKWTSSGGWVEKQTNSNIAETVGRTFEKVGSVIAISCNGGILYSNDNGETWQVDTSLGVDSPGRRCIFGNEAEGIFYAGWINDYGQGWNNLRVYRGVPGNWGTYINEYVGTVSQTFSNNISRDMWASSDGKVFALLSETPNGLFVYGLEEGGTVATESDGSNGVHNIWGFSASDVYYTSTPDMLVRYWNGSYVNTEDVTNFYENGNWGIEHSVGTAVFSGHRVSFTGQELAANAIAYEVGAGATHALKALTGKVELDDGVVILGEQSSAPATPTNKGVFYTKEVSGETEAFYLDTAGNEVQLTSGGSVSGGGGGPVLIFVDDTEFTETGGTAVTKKQFRLVLDSAAKPTSLKLVCGIWAIAGTSPTAEVSFAVTGGTTQTATETGGTEAIKKLTMSATPISTDAFLTVEVKLRISAGSGTAYLKYTDIYAVY